MEGASPLRGEPDLLDTFYELGVRSLGLTHNPRNEAGDGCMLPDGQRRGLTDFGRLLVRRCAELGILLDVAHLAPEGFVDLMDEVSRPLAYSLRNGGRIRPLRRRRGAPKPRSIVRRRVRQATR